MIDGKQLALAMISGANHIRNRKVMVDKLNVFPVPDGDTGTNMSMTIQAGKQALINNEENQVGRVAKIFADALLRGARGNSGVILSLLFRGFAQGLKGKEQMGAADLAEAMELGVQSAYKAVMTPTEGTILTVARLSAEKIRSLAEEETDPVALFEIMTAEAKRALDTTPELLPVLKKAGVVDAGGMGLLVIFEGMLSYLKDGECIELQDEPVKKEEEPTSFEDAAAQFDGNITFTYCTEYIVDKKEGAKDALALRAYLESIGDSVVVVDDEEIIKVHVHTDHPGSAIEEGLLFGSLMNLKIDNMRKQHKAKKDEFKKTKENRAYVKVDESIPYGFVSVSAGEGLKTLFTDLGVNQVVSGGQTMNPSTEDILNAIHAVPAKTVFVLPNNKNIIMAAEQAVKLADRKVCVLQSRTIPQGIAAMLAFDEDATFDQNRVTMTKALERIQTGQITFAARNSDFDGHQIKQGEILALDNGKLAYVEKDINKALYRLTRQLTKKSDGEFITLIYGSNITASQAEEAMELLQAKFGDRYEINLISGGQPVYYYILSVE